MLAREAKSPKAFGTSGRVVSKRSAGSSIRPVTIAEPSPGEGAETSGPASVEEDMVQEAEGLKSVPAPVPPSTEEVESHNVSHLPLRSWCSACVRGRGLSLGHHKVDAKTKEAEQIPTVSLDWVFFGNPRIEHTIRCQCSSCGIARVKVSGVTQYCRRVVYPYPAKALMNDLDFMGYKRIVLKSDQEPSIVALCDAVKSGWHGEIEASPKGESKSNGEVEHAVQSVHGLPRTQRLPGAEIWNCAGVPESVVGLAGRALF